MFVKISSRFRAEVWVEKDGERVNGKSIMGLMMLAAGKGSKLHLIAEGADADKVIAEIENLVQTRFGEEQIANGCQASMGGFFAFQPERNLLRLSA